MVWQAIAGIAGAAASLFGGSDDEQKTVTESRVNYRQLVRSAQRAGINPLTALRTGGAAGFTTQTTTAPALASESLLGRIAQATGLVAEGLSNQQKWEQSQQRLALEERLIGAQIANLESTSTGAVGPRLAGPAMGQPGPAQPHTAARPRPGSMPGTPGQHPPNFLITLNPDGTESMGPHLDYAPDAEQELWWWAKRGVFLEEAQRMLYHNVDHPKTLIDKFHRHITETNPFPNTPGSTNEKVYDFFQETLPGAFDWWSGAWDRTVERWGPPYGNPLRQPREPIN